MLCYPSQSARLCQNCGAAELFYVSVLPMDDRHQLGGCLFFFFKLRCGYIYGVFEYVWIEYGVYVQSICMGHVCMEVSKRCIKTVWQ